MKILITGASGNLGQLTRILFADHIVHLSSRKKIEINKNEFWAPSQDLTNYEWWSKYDYLDFYDVIFHFAEPVKVKISSKAMKSITKSHLSFLTNAMKNSRIVIYPMTAYKHDKKINSLQKDYLKLKTFIFNELSYRDNIKFPIFHPLVNYGNGLSKIINITKKIPFFNIFFAFKALLPILYKSDLEEYIMNVININEKCPEVYSEILPISAIFNDNKRINSAILSKFILIIMRSLNNSTYYLLLNGRKIQS